MNNNVFDDPGKNFDAQGRFILADYDHKKPFSSFLPGIAGLTGIPMWVFYVNRGQAITSFGVESKDHPIMEFQSANKAYQLTATLGFRTFVKLGSSLCEPFSPWSTDHVQRVLFIGMNELEIRETDPDLGLETSVLYFSLPGEPFAGLARRVNFRNLSDRTLRFEVLDGMPVLVPYGLDNNFIKSMGRTSEAWMEVVNLEHRIPFYKLRASMVDSTEVSTIESGNYAFAFLDQKLLPVIVDPVTVFDHDTTFAIPQRFMDLGLDSVISDHQVTEGRTPCAFFGAQIELAPGQSKDVTSLFGYASSLGNIEHYAAHGMMPGYVDNKLAETRTLALDLTEPIATHSASPIFDAYCRQTFLDNILRGGWPISLGDEKKSHVYHVYSRKHGDPERDYNSFFLAAEYYSQGNGNYRDVNQNRRNDVFFAPRVGDFNIRLFMSLIQADGYNPLVVRGTTFHLPPEKRAKMLEQVTGPAPLEALLAKPFTPGKLLQSAIECGLRIPPQDFLNLVLSQSEQRIEANYGEGFWIDHWFYNLDLIDSYLAVFPDKKALLLFDSDPLPFYESPVTVLPRGQKYALVDGKPRQGKALYKDPEKVALIASRADQPNWTRTQHGKGEIFRLPLISKLVLLALLKFDTLDPFGMGIEMEAERPGWCDALNGLPGLFGSSLSETFELMRLVNFLVDALTAEKRAVSLPVEAEGLLRATLANPTRDHLARWDANASAREAYRAATRLGFDGSTRQVQPQELLTGLGNMQVYLKDSLQRAMLLGRDVPPTYLYYAVTGFTQLEATDEQGHPFIRPTSFETKPLPPYLEAPVHAMKILGNIDATSDLYAQVKASPLFDRKLKMYRLNASLRDQPHDIGRARAFTTGWLENESVFMHMEYKYLLEVLKAGLVEEFFADLKTTLVPFLDPQVYGRSPLENSTFIASSAHPDEALHGTGFVARLSGTTSEFLSIWNTMMTGSRPFIMQGADLCLAFRPSLPNWLFDKAGELSFKFLGQCTVTIHNPGQRDVHKGAACVNSITLHLANGQSVEITGGVIGTPYAGLVREGKISSIDLMVE
jgi:hypothetical protein